MITTTLASFPSPSQGVWHISLWNVHIPIRAYALFIIIGIIAALLIGDRRWAARGGEKGVIYDIALWAVPFGLVGGRLYHVLTDWPTYFGAGGAGPLAAFRVWDGGLGIWGAVALGGVGAWIGCRRRGIPLPAFGDAIAPGIVLAQAIGRVGNYFNQELYGRETTLPWGMEIFYRQDPSGIVDVHSLNGVSTGQLYAVVHPTFLYELLWNLLVFVILILVDRRYKIGHGRLFALYVALYCVGRFCVELLRDDNATHIAGIRINSFTSTFVFLGAVVYIVLAKKGREDPRTLGGHQEESEAPAKVPVFAKEFAAVASGTGVVAAATVAGREDTDYDVDPETLDVLETAEEVESVDEFEPLDESQVVDETEALDDPGTAESEPTGSPEADTEADIAEPEDLTADVVLAESDAGEPIESESVVVGDADDVEGETEDEAIIEAEVASPAVAVESVVDAEEELIDEDHDPIDEDELEGLLEGDVTSGPLSEQEESLESEQDAPEPEVAVAPELAEAEVAVEPVVSELAEAEVAVEPGVPGLAEAEVAVEPGVSELAEAEVAVEPGVSELAEAEVAVEPGVSELAEAEVAVEPGVSELAEAEVAVEPGVSELAEAEVAVEPGVPELAEAEVAVEPGVPELAEAEVAVEPGVPGLAEAEVAVEPGVPGLAESEVAVEPDVPELEVAVVTETAESADSSMAIYYASDEALTDDSATIVYAEDDGDVPGAVESAQTEVAESEAAATELAGDVDSAQPEVAEDVESALPELPEPADALPAEAESTSTVGQASGESVESHRRSRLGRLFRRRH